MAKSFSKKAEKKANEAETLRRRTFLKEVLLPYISKNSKSIYDAKLTCKAAVMIMQERFNAMVQELSNIEQKRISDDLLSQMEILKSGKSPEQKKALKEFEGLFKLLEGEKVSTAEAFLVGMAKSIEASEIKEMRDRKLDSLDVASMFS